MSRTLDTQRTFGSRFAMTGEVVATPLYDEHQARDIEHGVPVGLWLPRPRLFASPGATDQLARAVDHVRTVIHPRLRRVFAAGDAPAVWLSLQPALPLVVDAAVPREQLIGWIDGIAGALLALHWAGTVHGGALEPDVVMIDGELRLGGGGIWAAADPLALAGAVGGVMIAPERRAGSPATAISDAWSLAALIARWVAGPGPDPLLAAIRRHPALAAELGPMLTDDPVRRRHDLIEFVASARAALATPYSDEADAPIKPRGRRRKKNTTEERTEVGHAPGYHHDNEPTERSAAPVPPAHGDADLTVPRNIADVKSAPILAVSMKPGGPASRRFEQPTPPAPTPQLQRPVIRQTTSDDAGASLGRLAPPRAKVEAARREARRPWIIAVVLGALVVAVVVLAVLVAR